MSNDPSHSEHRYWLAGGRKPVPHLTEAAIRFAGEHSRLLDFHVFFSEAKLRKFIDKQQGETEELKALLLEIQQHDALLTEVVICRVVDNFLSFVSDLLALIYKVRPEMLRSSEQERIDFVLRFESMDELRSALAEKRVERLAYLGLRDLAEHLKSQMGFDLFPVTDQLDRAAMLVEYRNLFVHNRGVVSSMSVRRFTILKEHLGKRIEIPPKDVRELRQFLENAALDIDIRASTKFSLPVASLPEPPEHLIG